MTEVTYARQFLALLDNRTIKLPADYVADARTLPAQSALILPRMPKPLSKRPSPHTQADPTSTTRTTTTSIPSAANTGATGTTNITLTLRPLRITEATPTITLAVPPTTSIWDVKREVATRCGYAADKVKVLFEKRPVADSKMVKEVGPTGASNAELELGLMFVGQPSVVAGSERAGAGAGAGATAGKDAGTGGTGMETGAPGSEAAAREAAAAGTGAKEGGEGDGDVEMGDAGGAPMAAQGQAGREVLATGEFWEDLRGFILQRTRDEEVAGELIGVFREAWRVKG